MAEDTNTKLEQFIQEQSNDYGTYFERLNKIREFLVHNPQMPDALFDRLNACIQDLHNFQKLILQFEAEQENPTPGLDIDIIDFNKYFKMRIEDMETSIASIAPTFLQYLEGEITYPDSIQNNTRQ